MRRAPTPAVPRRKESEHTGRLAAGRAADRVQPFLHGLRRVPIADWCRCAGATSRVDLDLYMRLRRTLDDMPVLEARIRRRVDHVLGACEGIAAPAALAGMRTAACLAAGALAARAALTRDEFERLYAAFATLVPVAAGEPS